MEKSGGSKPHRYWRDLAIFDQWICGWCGDRLPDDTNLVEVDHIVSLARGGCNCPLNLQTLHADCNHPGKQVQADVRSTLA